MDRSLMLKASALARGTRKIDLSILRDDPDVLEAEFVDLPAVPVSEPVMIDEATLPAVIPPANVTPGRARRATDAYAPAREVSKIIAIG